MSAKENKALVRRFVDEVQSQGNVDAIYEFCSPEFVNHSAPPGLPPDREGIKQLTALFRAAFPDSYFTVEDMLAEGDKVATRKTFHGTHQGEFMGILPTGRQVSTGLIDIVRIADGRVVEHWSMGDNLGMMQQLGVVPKPGDTEEASPTKYPIQARTKERTMRHTDLHTGVSSMPEPANLSGYLPIAEHGLIGDLHTVALVGTEGTIDWYCCPRFDAPSLFGALLDRERGGYWRLAPTGTDWTTKQLYFPDTNILITRFLSPNGVGEVQDFMPVASSGRRPHRLIRRLLCVRGQVTFGVEVEPRFDYGRQAHRTHLHKGGAVFESPTLAVALDSPLPLERSKEGVRASFALKAGQSTTFVLESIGDGEEPRRYSEDETRQELEDTVAFWRGWLSRSRYEGRWRETVHRSALTLKLLTYAPTGAIVAAPTTSLPEQPSGGGRNWDYRYTWIRDAAFSLYALLRLGFTEEAEAFMSWLTERFREDRSTENGPLQIMYGIDGRTELPEEVLGHLEGYRSCGPVRVGNAAAEQLQLDIYGELIDSVYLYNKYGTPIYHDAWEDLARVVEWVCEHWDEADEGIWETRGGRKHFTHSRLMSWVAIERAIRIARQRGLPADLVHWLSVRDAIYRQIMARAWHPRRKAFVQHYDTDVLDASVLLMPLVKFLAPTDPRWISTLDAIKDELVSDSLVYRYNPVASPDGLEGEEGTFSMCTFWYVEALAWAGRSEEAQLIFEKMLTYANHLGLYAEEIGPSGEALGNFPQAFTHLALISAAFNLDRQLG